MSRTDQPMSPEAANAVFDALVEHFDVSENRREEFVFHQTNAFHSEYRIGGVGGFGGKFWRNPGYDNRETRAVWREQWYVNAYREDEERYPEIRPAIEVTNAVLRALRDQYLLVEADA